MAMRYRAAPAALTQDRRQQSWTSASSIGERFPRAGSFSIELRFRDPEAKIRPSPFRQLYEPSMQAYFDLRCPLPECSGGGFDLQAAVCRMLADRKVARSGSVSCAGKRADASGNRCCALELTYTLAFADDESNSG